MIGINRAKTWFLIAALGGLFVLVGYAIGGASGGLVALGLALVFNFAMYWYSARIAIATTRSKPVTEQQAPELYRIVRELAQAHNLPMPTIYVSDIAQPNAFATGRNPEHAAVAVTQGLLQYLPRDQVKGVLAHEFAHVKNRDILVSSIAAMIAGAISAVGNIFLWTSLFGGEDDDNPLGAIGGLVVILVAPLAAMLLQLAVSRQREYLADATAARMLGGGESLADALETLERGRQVVPMQVNPATSSLYIVNPLRAAGMTALFQTHPPIEERIARLRAYDRNRGIV